MVRTHDFFLATNLEAMEIRKKVADEALNDALAFLKSDGEAAILDATNVTLERRRMVHQRVVDECGYKCIFIESICDNPEIIKNNIAEVKIHGPDYIGMPAEVAALDFEKRIEHYFEAYTPMSDDLEPDMTFFKVINAGDKLVIHKHEGNLQSRIGYWLMNIHAEKRTIYLTRHGESEMNVIGRIGGDCGLSPRGLEYKEALAKYINAQQIRGLKVWTSCLKRTIQTASGINAPQERWKALNEINAGCCEEMTYEEIAAKYPKDYAAREKDKLTFRYPMGGESYEDVIFRLEAVIMELERQENVLVVSHQAVLRCILCYFMDLPLEELPYVKIPLHTLIKISPVAYGCEIEQIPLGIEAVDTHRPRTT